jgi:mRNA interferase MazF
MRRSEVWWVDFNPFVGEEIQKVRPAIVVSNDMSNQMTSRVQVVPITSSTHKCYPCEAYVHIKGKLAKAMADQLTTVSSKRLQNKIGHISLQEMQDVERAIKIQLDL